MKTDSKNGFLCRLKSDGTSAQSWNVRETPLVIGRGDSAAVVIEDEALSRTHFLVVREGDDFLLVDLDSRNGTAVNGEKISTHRLQPNDIIQAGGAAFCFLEARNEMSDTPEVEPTLLAPGDALSATIDDLSGPRLSP